MKVLVTGATGFIGNYVITALLKRGINVIATAQSDIKAQKKNWHNQVSFIPHTIGNESAAENLFEKFQRPNAIIHLAWQGLPNYRQLYHFEEVLPAQYTFIKQLVSQGLKDVTITGTCFEYGMQEGKLSEDMPALPDNPYALAKHTLHCFLDEYKKTTTFKLKWVRLFYMYGEGQSPTSVLSQLDKALDKGDETFNMSMGDQLRDYLPVEKMAENIVDICLQNNVTGTINSCSGTPISIRTLVQNHLKQKQKNIYLNFGHYPYPDYEPRNFWGDSSKLKTITDV